MNRRILILGLLCSLLALTGCRRETDPWGEPGELPELQVLTGTDTVRIGDPIEVRLRLTAESPVTLPAWNTLLHEDIRILDDRSPSGARNEAGLWEQHTTLRLAVFDVGEILLFPESGIETEDDPPVELALPHFVLTVEALTGEDTEAAPGDMTLMDLRGPEALRRLRRNLLLSATAGILLLLALLYLAHRLRQRPAPPPPPPRWDKIALRAIAELRSRDIWVQGDADASAVVLSDILRSYIENQFRIHAPELTTEEFLHEAAALQPWPDEDQKSLEAFFTAVDQIKFAAARPGRDVLDELMRAAERFVHVTGTPSAEGQS